MPYRVPVVETYRKKSPFDGLLEHMHVVKKCISMLTDEVIKYYDGNFEGFAKVAEEVSKMEHEADLIKGNIRAHLPRSILMPVDKKYFLWLLREEDSILDHAENLAQLLDLRHTRIPDELREDFKEHARKVAETVEEMEKAVGKVKELVETGFASRIREEVKKLIHNVHKKEWEADQVAEVHGYDDLREFSDYIYNGNLLILDVSPISIDDIELERITNELKRIVRDIDGDIAGLDRNHIIVTPSGVKIDRRKLRKF